MQVYYVVDTVVDQLVKDPKRHFICDQPALAPPRPIPLDLFSPVACRLVGSQPLLLV